MTYLNYAALSPTRVDAEREVLQTLDAFKPLLYSEAGLQWYLEKSSDCRNIVARFLHVENPDTIAFVPNASTANHLVLASLEWQPDDLVLTTTHENPSIMRELRRLTIKGVRVDRITPLNHSAILGSIEKTAKNPRLKVIVLSHVSHVDGRIFPVQEISVLAAVRGIPLIIDGAQAVGHIPVDLRELNGAVYFFTGHKWCEGPLGTGAMVIPDPFLTLNPAFAGLAKETRKPPASLFEIGTHNIGLIAGLAKTCSIKYGEGLHQAELEGFRKEAKDRLGTCPGIQFMEWEGPHAPGILTIQGPPTLDHVRFAKDLAEKKNIIVKVFSDYPEEAAPALRLSWSGSASKQEVSKAFDTIAHYFNRSA